MKKRIPLAGVAALAGVVTSSTAFAQPFVEAIGEPQESAELARDLTLLGGGEIAFVGDIRLEAFNLRPQVYVGITDPNGAPLTTVIIDDSVNQSVAGYAIREDPADRNLILLYLGDQLAPAAGDEMVLSKLDPFGLGFAYQWRYPMHDGGGFVTGMELDGSTGLIASSARGTNVRTEATLLRFDNATGLPVFYQRYFPFGAPIGDSWFVDVTSDPATGDIFAVGSIEIDEPAFTPGPIKLYVARFDAAGNPIWLNAYDAAVPGADANEQLGLGIELVDSQVIVVNAEINGVAGGAAALTLALDVAIGAPIANLSLDGSPQGIEVQPAASSLELLPNRSLLESGTLSGNIGAGIVPSMWSVNLLGGGFDWIWAPDRAEGTGFSAIPQPDADVLLTGEARAYPNGPIGNLPDVFLARTDDQGQGLCPLDIPLEALQLEIVFTRIQVDPAGMPMPIQAGLEAFGGEPVSEQICAVQQPCSGDFNGDSFRDTADLLILLANFNMPGGIAQGDANNDGFVDTADLLILLANFNTPCP